MKLAETNCEREVMNRATSNLCYRLLLSSSTSRQFNANPRRLCHATVIRVLTVNVVSVAVGYPRDQTRGKSKFTLQSISTEKFA